MAPEQAKGRPADKRSDIWAFGCVLYEMLTGKRAFDGEDVSDTLAAILRGEPNWNALPAQTRMQSFDSHAAVSRRSRTPPGDIGECHPRDRGWRIADDFASGSVTSALLRPPRTAWIAASFFLATTVAAIAAAYFLRTPADTHVFRAEIPLPLNLSPAAPASRMAVSPDGRQLAFIARSTDGAGRLWLRHFDSLSVRPLPGTEDASAVFWSSDNRSLAFIAGRRLKRLDPSGGSAIILADAPSSIPTPGSWNRDNAVLFTPANDSPISRVSAAGGAVTAVTAVTVLDKANGETRHAFPFFLPDHRHFLYAAFNGITPLGL